MRYATKPFAFAIPLHRRRTAGPFTATLVGRADR